MSTQKVSSFFVVWCGGLNEMFIVSGLH